MMLRQGENLFEVLERLAIKEKIRAASISGMGFVNRKFGYFSKATPKYDPREFYDMELVSLSGSVAWDHGKPSMHLHGVNVADKDFMLSAVISGYNGQQRFPGNTDHDIL